jgi:hypothetical protein
MYFYLSRNPSDGLYVYYVYVQSGMPSGRKNKETETEPLLSKVPKHGAYA